MVDMPKITIIDSNIEHNGTMKQCISAIVEPYPTDLDEIIQLGDDIRAAISNMYIGRK